MNVLMLSQVAGYLSRASGARYQALLCCSGSNGYAAFRRFLEFMEGCTDEQRSIMNKNNKEYDTILLLTNVDMRDALPPTTALLPTEGAASCTTTTATTAADTDGDYHAVVDECDAGLENNKPFSLLLTPQYLITNSGRNLVLALLLSCTHVSVFGSVSKLPWGFLRKCTTLKTVDLNGLSSTSELPSFLLCGCTSMRTVHWSSLRFKEIPYGCLQECRGLTSVDLSLFENAMQIQGGFLEGCASLTSLDLTPLQNVTSISCNFLKGCSGLLSINFSAVGAHVTSISSGFLGNCSNLTEVDLSSFVVLKNNKLPYECFVGCSRLQSIKYPPNMNVDKYQEARCFWVKQNSTYDRNTDNFKGGGKTW